MKQKKAGYVLVAGLLLFNLHFLQGAVEENQQSWLRLRGDPVASTWVSGASFSFQGGPAYQQAHFRKVSQALANESEVVRKESEGKGGRSPAQLIEQVPQIRSVVVLKDKVMNKVSPVLENPDGRLFMPMFNSDNQNKMPRQEFSGAESFAAPDSESRESGRSSRAQERYVVGYRLSSKASQQSESWFVGLGWKSGGGRGRRDLDSKEDGDMETSRTNTLSESNDQGQNAVKVEYSGPIVGLVGQF